MEKEQIKTILVNTLTVVLIVGVAVVAYNIFLKKGTTSISSVNSVAAIAQETAQIGTEIDATVSDLGELSNSISNSAVILNLPAFKNLKDFTVEVPSLSVGRQNPFTLTPWKVQENAVVGAANSGSTSSQAPVSSPAPTVPDLSNSGI